MHRLSLASFIITIIMLLTIIPGLNPGSRGSSTLFRTSQDKADLPPLKLRDIEELIQIKEIKDITIAAEIRERRLLFTVTEKILADLKSLGAGPRTIEALRTKIPKRVRPHGTLAVLTPVQKTIILIANFDGPDPRKYGVTDGLIRDLNEETGIYPDLAVEPLATTVTEQNGGSKVAKNLGTKRKASIVIWGYYRVSPTNVQVSTYFEALRKPSGFNLRKNFETQVYLIDELNQFHVQPIVSKKMTYLVLLTAGLLRYHSSDFEGAIERFTKALTHSDVQQGMVDPRTIYIYRGLAYANTNRMDLAAADYDQLLKLKPVFAHRAVQIQDGVSKILFNRGFFHLEDALYERAMADFNRAIQLEPDFTELYVLRGLTYIFVNQYDRAIADSDMAIKLQPDLAGAYNNRGEAYRNKGQYHLSIADFSKAIALNNNYVNAYRNRGKAYYEINQKELAIYDYARAIQLKPDYALAYFDRGLAYYQQNAFDAAIADYDKAIEFQPDFADAYYYRGQSYIQKGVSTRGIADYGNAINLKPDFAEFYLQRGNEYAKMNEFERAIGDYNAAIRLKPDYIPAYNSRAIAYQLKGDRVRAIADRIEAAKLQRRY